MSDFSDEQDVQLFVLAKEFVDANKRISWADIEHAMKNSKKTRKALQERFQTLKRTYGKDIYAFPNRFFCSGRTARVHRLQIESHIERPRIRNIFRSQYVKGLKASERKSKDKQAVAALLHLFALHDNDEDD